MRIFVHLEQQRQYPEVDREFTIVQRLEQSTKASNVLDCFIQNLKKAKNGVELPAGKFSLATDSGKLLPDQMKLINYFDDGDDIFVVATGASSSQSTASTAKAPIKNQDASNKPSATSSSGAEESKKQKQARKELLDKLTISVSERANRRAIEIGTALLKHDAKDAEVLKLLAAAYHSSGDYDRAADLYRSFLLQQPSSIDGHLQLSQTLMKAKEFDEALVTVNSALKLIKELKAKKGSGSGLTLKEKEKELELIAQHAECLFELGQHTAAADILNKSMSNPLTEKSIPIHVTYAYIALKYRKMEEAGRALLMVLTTNQNLERAKELMAEMLDSEEGFKVFLMQMPVNKQRPASETKAVGELYAYLGYITKCYSAIKASIQLYNIGLEMSPSNASFVLNLVHVHEIEGNYAEALSVALKFMEANMNKRVGPQVAAMSTSSAVEESGSVTCSDMHALLTAVTASSDSSEHQQQLVEWVEQETDGYFNVVSASQDENNLKECGDKATKRWISHKYTVEELDLLALFFTTAKIVFLQGKLSFLPAIIKLLEVCRMQSDVSLHETSIRNEHAYFQQICHILSYRCKYHSYGLYERPSADAVLGEKGNWYPLKDIPSRAFLKKPSAVTSPDMLRLEAASVKPLYLCGDSHCLSAAYSIIDIRGEPRLIIPKLVTGLKQWHLRVDSKFYPKAHFRNIMNTIPDGAEVVFVVGEIDCREGILLAVEHGYYSSYEAAMQSTLKSFMPALKEVIVRKKLQAYVHPVVPVLDATRPIVTKFNSFFKDAVNKLKGVNVRWLDMFSDLVVPCDPPKSNKDASAERPFGPVTSVLREELKLDGTHLNPSYVRLIEESINSSP